MSNLTISSSAAVLTPAPAAAGAGIVFNKSNRVLGFSLQHTVGAHGAAICTVWGYSITQAKWYRLKFVNVDTSNNPSVYDVDIFCLGWDRLYLQIDGLGTITDLTYELVHECHYAGGR